MKHIPFVIAVPLIVVFVLGASVVAWKLGTTPAPAPSQMPAYDVSVDTTEESSDEPEIVAEAADPDVAGMQQDLESLEDDTGQSDLDALDQDAASL